MRSPSPGSVLVLVLLLVPVIAGCMAPDGDGRHDTGDGDDAGGGTGDGGTGGTGGSGGDGDHGQGDGTWQSHTSRFDGRAAYDLTLRQLYDDPDAKAGPRYRIPGTADHALVADLLQSELETALGDSGGRVTRHSFTGDDYYALDLTRVRSWTCDPENPSQRTDRVRDLTFHNLAAHTHPGKIGWIVAAHWDSKREGHDPDGGSGPILAADDGAASTAIVVELARTFSEHPIDVPLTFLLFDGEDGFEDCHPLAGSLHYAQEVLAADAELHDTAEGLILLDMVGNSSARFYHEGNSRAFTATSGERVVSRPLLDLVWDTAAHLGDERFIATDVRLVFDDHVPFLDEGVRSIDVIRYDGGFAPYWHTTRDDHTAVDEAGITSTGAVIETALVRIEETGLSMA